MSQLPSLYGLAYMAALLLSFYAGFYIVMSTARGYSFREKMRYGVTAGLLSTKFIIFIATLLGIDHVFLVVGLGPLHVPVTANLILFMSNLAATLSINWERLKQHLTVSEEEYWALLE